MALSGQQIQNLWIARGGDPKYARTMAQIALRESGGRPGINNRGTNQNGTTDWGLYQVNDIWRKDPTVGRLFRNGDILTPKGATDAAIHILQVQGPRAWATYNPTTDRKYLGGLTSGRAATVKNVGGGSASRTIPGVDNSQARRDLIVQYLAQEHQPGSLVGLAEGLQGAQDSPARTVTIPASASAPVPGQPRVASAPVAGGVAMFEGQKVAGWIRPALEYARAHGWRGTVTSGYRSDAVQTRIYKSGVRPAAVPQSLGGHGSNHEFTTFPGGAVDVSDPQTLARILQSSPFRGRLVWAGAKDAVHFSHPHNGSY